MRLEASDDLPAGPDYSYVAIVAPEKQAVGSGADTRYVVALEEGARVVIGESNLADFEEVEGLPLCASGVSTRSIAMHGYIQR